MTASSSRTLCRLAASRGALFQKNGSNIRTIHYLDNCPTLVAGGGSGIRLGEHVVVPDKTPLANLWLTLLQGSGVKAGRHGDSTGVVAEITG